MTNITAAFDLELPRTSIGRLRVATVRRVPALGLSFAAHGIVLAALLYSGIESKPPPRPVVRLVFVDAPPMTPAPPVPTAAASPPAAVPDAPAVRPKAVARRPLQRIRPAPIQNEPAITAPALEQPSVTSSATEEPAQGTPAAASGGSGSNPILAASAASPPVLVDRVVPVYPSAARQRGIAGLVRLEAILDTRGRVEEPIRVLQSIAELDSAAIEALRRWRFAPARDHHGQPVAVILEVPIRFVLR